MPDQDGNPTPEEREAEVRLLEREVQARRMEERLLGDNREAT